MVVRIVLVAMALMFVHQAGADVYRSFSVRGVTQTQANDLDLSMGVSPIDGVSSWGSSFNPSIGEYSLNIASTSTSKSSKINLEIRNKFLAVFGKTPSSEVARRPGERTMSGQDRCLEMKAALQSNTDPKLIGIKGDKITDRKRNLKTAVKACTEAWSLK